MENLTSMGGTGSGCWTCHNKKRTLKGPWAIRISGVALVVNPSEPSTAGCIDTDLPAGRRYFS
jgi:hypothetical protein